MLTEKTNREKRKKKKNNSPFFPNKAKLSPSFFLEKAFSPILPTFLRRVAVNQASRWLACALSAWRRWRWRRKIMCEYNIMREFSHSRLNFRGHARFDEIVS